MAEASPDLERGRLRSELAADRIRDDILRGTYRAGERLPGERDMAAHLGVHRGAVREALKALELQGLVTTRPGGTTVCAVQEASIGLVRHLLAVDGEPDRARIEQLLDVHEMLVSGAARLAVERGSDDDLQHAQELVARLADPAEGDLQALFDEIVDLITRASANLVLQLWRNTVRPALAESLAPLRASLRPSSENRETVDALADAIERRDPAATEEAVRALLRERRSRLLAVFANRSTKR